jgi:hypothetical protein
MNLASIKDSERKKICERKKDLNGCLFFKNALDPSDSCSSVLRG